MNTDFNSIGQAFVQQYYNLFDTNRAELKVFYVSDCMSTVVDIRY